MQHTDQNNTPPTPLTIWTTKHWKKKRYYSAIFSISPPNPVPKLDSMAQTADKSRIHTYQNLNTRKPWMDNWQTARARTHTHTHPHTPTHMHPRTHVPMHAHTHTHTHTRTHAPTHADMHAPTHAHTHPHTHTHAHTRARARTQAQMHICCHQISYLKCYIMIVTNKISSCKTL